MNWIESMPWIPSDQDLRFPLPKLLKSRCDPMFPMALRTGEVRTVVEVGSQWGWWAWRALRHLPDATIYCIDPWESEKSGAQRWHGAEENLYDWARNLEPWLGERVFGLRHQSATVAACWEEEVGRPVDFIFIDGDHSYEGVMADLRGWVPLMREGGLIVGHDWGGRHGRNVSRAVINYFGSKQFKVGSIYWSYKGKELSKCWYRRAGELEDE